jgi:hypothetical protein
MPFRFPARFAPAVCAASLVAPGCTTDGACARDLAGGGFAPTPE